MNVDVDVNTSNDYGATDRIYLLYKKEEKIVLKIKILTGATTATYTEHEKQLHQQR